MTEAIKNCIKNDMFLRKKYIEEKEKGASDFVLNGIIERIIQNRNEYNKLISIDVNEENTAKHKVKKIEAIKDVQTTTIVHDSFFTGAFGMLSSLSLVVTFTGTPSVGWIAISTIAMGGLAYNAKNLAEKLIQKFKYKNEIKKIAEELEQEYEEGMVRK